ncbi:MAG: LytTR family DNA-binding domain-containing protein [Bacteroidota bacterium]
MMTCLIVEDQPPAQRILKKYIEDIGTLQLKATFPDAIQTMQFLEKERVDLLFLDIHLPKLSGLDFLNTVPNPPKVILTTAFSEYALESYEFNVVDYLLKPFSFQRFVKAVAKVSESQAGQDVNSKPNTENLAPKELYIKSGYELVKVLVDDIIYISADADYTEIITARKKHISSDPLRMWLEKLSRTQFHRIHKSHIINAKSIDKISGNRVCLKGGAELPIGRAYKEEFMQRLLG